MKSSRTNVWSFLIIALILVGIPTSVVGSVSYQSTITKGTEEFIIDQYNNTVWISTVDGSTDPSDWFEGDADIVGAKSKITVKGWVSTTWELYDALTTIIMPAYFTTEEIYMLLGIMVGQGFNETTINANYTSTYSLSIGLRSVWNFTSSSYEEDPSYTDGVFVLQDPSDFKTILDDYNALVEVLNGNMAILMLGGFPTLTPDEFLWQFAMNGFAIAEPQSDYLTDIITELGCVNVSASGTTLTFERYGVSDYFVEISYGSRGTISTFTVKDINEVITFSLTSYNSDWIFFTILITVSVSALLIIAYMIYRSRKLKKR